MGHRMGGATCRALKEARREGTEFSQVGRSEPGRIDGVERLAGRKPAPRRGSGTNGGGGRGSRIPRKGNGSPGLLARKGGENEEFFSPLPQRMI